MYVNMRRLAWSQLLSSVITLLLPICFLPDLIIWSVPFLHPRAPTLRSLVLCTQSKFRCHRSICWPPSTVDVPGGLDFFDASLVDGYGFPADAMLTVPLAAGWSGGGTRLADFTLREAERRFISRQLGSRALGRRDPRTKKRLSTAGFEDQWWSPLDDE